MQKTDLVKILIENQELMKAVMRFDPKTDPVAIMDLSASNKALHAVDVDDEESFSNFIFSTIKNEYALYGAGGYGENRILYQRSEVFEGDRTVHLGLDLWAEAGEEIYTPLDGVIHSFQDNDSHGDYGPTIIMQHHLNGKTFYTLYGHLSKSSLENKKEGQKVYSGQRIGWLGSYEENVHWPPHLHFQIIEELLGKYGDFPGVARPSESKKYLSLCPDPNLILQISALNHH